jgi:hypothetical protein
MNASKLCKLSAAVAGLLALAVPSLRALTYIDNLNQTTSSTNNLFQNWYGTQFTTDASAPFFSLDNITISVFSAASPGSPFTVNIFSDASGEPGSVLGVLTGTTPTGAGNFTFAATGITLSASTPYWVVVQVSGASTYLIADTHSSTIGGTWLTTTGGDFSTNSGALWVNSDAFGDRNQYALNATAVPEPSEYATMLGASALGLVLWRRRRSK